MPFNLCVGGFQFLGAESDGIGVKSSPIGRIENPGLTVCSLNPKLDTARDPIDHLPLQLIRRIRGVPIQHLTEDTRF
jgi:hypothetical protein